MQPNLTTKLPIELWLQIGSYDPIGFAALALTCRHMRWIYGEGSWAKLNARSKKELTKLLWQGRPIHTRVLCGDCYVSHFPTWHKKTKTTVRDIKRSLYMLQKVRAKSVDERELLRRANLAYGLSTGRCSDCFKRHGLRYHEAKGDSFGTIRIEVRLQKTISFW